MRGRFARFGDRAIGVVLGVVLGLVIIVLFLFLGSRSAIDEPSVSGDVTQTATQPVTPPEQSQTRPPQ